MEMNKSLKFLDLKKKYFEVAKILIENGAMYLDEINERFNINIINVIYGEKSMIKAAKRIKE